VPPACVRVAEPPSAGWRWGRGQVVASGTVVVAARAVAVAVSVRGPWLPT
jgi:flagella basal body P-ring formation protein FlgA